MESVLRRARARGRAPQRRPESETARREDAAAQSVTGIERRHRTDGGLFDAEKVVVGRLEEPSLRIVRPRPEDGLRSLSSSPSGMRSNAPSAGRVGVARTRL